MLGIKTALQNINSYKSKFDPIRSAVRSGVSSVKKQANDFVEMNNRYPKEILGYASSGGDSNSAESIRQFLSKRNLPGQAISGKLSGMRTNDSQYQTNVKMSRGVQLNPEESRRTQEAGMQMVAGMSQPVESLSDRVLSIKRQLSSRIPNTQMEAIGQLDQLAKRELDPRVIKNVIKLNPPESRMQALLAELETLAQRPRYSVENL